MGKRQGLKIKIRVTPTQSGKKNRLDVLKGKYKRHHLLTDVTLNQSYGTSHCCLFKHFFCPIKS